ncbi:MAG: hypothetical protein GTO40_08595, partial [Deltaproteobacteria bacterium]|nr:hypothetical protein [Deltaproteobacteria bacterium]
QLTIGPGIPYTPAPAWKEYLEHSQPGRKLLGDVENWDELDASQSIIVGSAETVTQRIWDIIEKSQVGNLLIQFHLGNMPPELVRKSMHLFATRVAPSLRERSVKLFAKNFPAAADSAEGRATR